MEAQDKGLDYSFKLRGLPRKLAKMLDEELGEEKRNKIMNGLEEANKISNPDKGAKWLKGVMENLENELSKEKIATILPKCSCQYPIKEIEPMKVKFEEIKDIDKLLQIMTERGLHGKKLWREGNKIYIEKNPSDPEELKKAKNEFDRIKASCYCPLVALSKLNNTFSKTYCYCGAGWYTTQWEYIFGQAVKVEVVESVINGGNVCKFAIHIPTDYNV